MRGKRRDNSQGSVLEFSPRSRVVRDFIPLLGHSWGRHLNIKVQ
jgi:hypothetical protein